MTNITNNRAEALMNVYEAGLNKALALAVGDVFPGAMPEAIAAGYQRGTAEYAVFVSGYMDGLRGRGDGVVCDHAGRVVEFR